MLITLNEAQKKELFNNWFALDEDLDSFECEEFGSHWRDRGWLAEQDVQIETNPRMELPAHFINWPAIFVNGIECTCINNDTYKKAWDKLLSLGGKDQL